MKNQVVILAAGKGTRMGEIDVPKVLVPLAGKAVIEHVLQAINKLPDIGPTILVVGHKHEVVKATLGDTYAYAIQEEQKGTAHALLAAKDEIVAENVVVVYGDMPFLTTEKIQELIELQRANNAKISMFTTVVPNYEGLYENMHHFGRIIRNENNEVVDIVEFKDATPEQQVQMEVNPGIYIFNTQWLWPHMNEINNNNSQGEYYLTDIIKIAIANGEKVYSLEIPPEQVFGINTKEHLEHAHTLLS